MPMIRRFFVNYDFQLMHVFTRSLLHEHTQVRDKCFELNIDSFVEPIKNKCMKGNDIVAVYWTL